MRISIFGLGYVGCVTAACLAREQNEVFGVDVSVDKVAMINAGESPVIEPGLAEIISTAVKNRQLRATVSADWAVKHSDLAMICVGTPSGANGRLDLSAMERVVIDIARALERRAHPYTVVLRSTMLPGTTEDLIIPIFRDHLGSDFASKVSVAVNPEFMREGTSIADFDHPPLTLIGCMDTHAAVQLRMLYRHIDAPVVETEIKVAEMAKYVSNAYHALKICFANEIGDLCESLGVNANDVMKTFMMDRKLNISEAYLRPGFAFGGSCLPKDLRALLHAAHDAYVDLPLLASVPRSNERQIRRGIDAVLATRKKRIGVVGLAFKSGTDDLRESPMVALVENLLGKGCSVRILDRNVHLASLVGANRRFIEKEIPHIASILCDSPEELLAHAEVIVVGGMGPDAERVLAQRHPGQTIVDLTRSLTPLHEPVAAAEALQAKVAS